MTTQVDAVFENGVFRPVRSVELPEHQWVRLTVEADVADQVSFTLPPDAWAAFCEALDAPPRTIPELGRLFVEPGVFDARPGSGQ
ncbi:MAG TPA: antitoxin AF2212-like protein [Gemmataceae bacterium]|nr:antitoxin AF2212-like protein [Gemmataceae bacterium]